MVEIKVSTRGLCFSFTAITFLQRASFSIVLPEESVGARSVIMVRWMVEFVICSPETRKDSSPFRTEESFA